MEAGDFLFAANAPDRNGVVDQARCAGHVQRRGDDAGFGLHRANLRIDLRLAQNQRAHALFHGAADDIILLSAEKNAILAGENGRIVRLGQRDDHFAGYAVRRGQAFVQLVRLQHRQQVEHRHVFQHRMFDHRNIEGCDVVRVQHSEELAFLIRHGYGGDRLIRLQHAPCVADRGGGTQRGRRIVIQIAHLRAHGMNEHRRFTAEALQHHVRFIADMTEARGDIAAVAQCVPQRGICHCGYDGIRIGVSMAGYIGGFQGKHPL